LVFEVDGMKRIDKFIVLVGIAVGAFLTWYAYYSNSHREVTRINEFVYLVLFPPSIGLLVTENASSSGQVIIVLIVVAANGFLYGLASAAIRKIFS
jgi:hypothetical protein